MTFDDQLHISTPEGVDLELTLAGLGSRLGGAFLDYLIKLVFEIVLLLLFIAVASRLHSLGAAIALGIFIVIIFAIDFGYDVLWEVLGSGRTIGKRALGTRVLKADGSPVDFRSSAIRNLLRLVDGSLTGYVVGTVTILATKKHQRLGDLAAGTVVVRDRQPAVAASDIQYIYATGEPRPWDAVRVDREIVTTLRNFLARRATLEPVVRNRLAADLYQRIRPLVGGVAEEMIAEAFLEEVVRLKSFQ